MAACILTVSVLCVFAHVPKDRNIDTENISPSIISVGGIPVSRQKHGEKFGAYTHVSYENGKKIATIFSSEQIKEIEDRRANGEWLSLTTEEALYLINDTISLFNAYDIVKINTLKGNTKTYQTSGNEANIYDVMLFRLEALHSGLSREPISGMTNEMVLFTGLKEKKNQLLIDFEADKIYSFYYEKLKFNYTPICHGSVLMFYEGSIYFVNDISQGKQTDMLCIYQS